MFLIFFLHPLWLTVAAALQFSAVRRAEDGSQTWNAVSKALTVLALIAIPMGLWMTGQPRQAMSAPVLMPLPVAGPRILFGGIVVALAGIAGQKGWEPLTRWFRWLALICWCLSILMVFGVMAFLWNIRNVNLH